MNFKKGDTVKIITGKDRGKRGKILQVYPKNNKVVVEGLNLMVKNVRPKKMGEKGQVVRYNAPIDASNAELFCDKCNKAVRVGFKNLDNKKKVRVCKKCKEIL